MLWAVVFAEFCCVMKVDISAFRLCWLLTFLDWMVCGIFDGLVFFAKVVTEIFYIAVNWVFWCTLTSCFSIIFGFFLDRRNVKTLPLFRCKTAFIFCFLRKKVFIDCSRGYDADGEHVVAVCNVRIWSTSLYCATVFGTSLRLIALWHIVYRKPRFFASEPFIGVCRVLHCELAHTVNSRADLSIDRFWCCELLFLSNFVV